METAALITFMAAGIFGLMITASIARGWAFSVLWGWFVVPIFGLPEIGIAQAIGIAITLSLITHQYVPSKEKDTWMPILTALLSPPLAVLIGLVVRRWL